MMLFSMKKHENITNIKLNIFTYSMTKKVSVLQYKTNDANNLLLSDIMD